MKAKLISLILLLIIGTVPLVACGGPEAEAPTVAPTMGSAPATATPTAIQVAEPTEEAHPAAATRTDARMPSEPPEPLPAPEGEKVQGLIGTIVSEPAGSQYDDHFQWEPGEEGRYGIDAADPALNEQIVALRDSGKQVRVWGVLMRDVPDVHGQRLQVTNIEIVTSTPSPDPRPEEEVTDWHGEIFSHSSDAQFDDYFRLDSVDEPGGPAREVVEAFLQAIMAGDVDTALSYWRLDAPDHPSGYAQTMRQMLEGWAGDTRFAIGRTHYAGFVATQDYQVLPEGDPRVEGATVELRHANLEGFLSLKLIDGRWLIHGWMTPTGQPDRFFGIDSLDPEIRQQLADLRDSGKTLRIWGKLIRDVPDAYGSQIQVTRLIVDDGLAPVRTPAPSEEVDGWMGTLIQDASGAESEAYFRRDDGEEYGITWTDESARLPFERALETGARVKVWGLLIEGVPVHKGRQIQAQRVDAVP